MVCRRQQFYGFAVLSTILSLLVSTQTTSNVFPVSTTWVAGSNVTGLAAVYGSPGIASATADPGNREAACSQMSPTGPDTLYPFGGYSFYSMLRPNFISYVIVSDFWSLDVSCAWWTTIHVMKSQSIGSPGIYSATVFPGHKYAPSCVVNPYDNQFYVFSGYVGNSNRENMMWNFALQQWAFLKGTTVATTYSAYGTSEDTSGNLNDIWYLDTSNFLPAPVVTASAISTTSAIPTTSAVTTTSAIITTSVIPTTSAISTTSAIVTTTSSTTLQATTSLVLSTVTSFTDPTTSALGSTSNQVVPTTSTASSSRTTSSLINTFVPATQAAKNNEPVAAAASTSSLSRLLIFMADGFGFAILITCVLCLSWRLFLRRQPKYTKGLSVVDEQMNLSIMSASSASATTMSTMSASSMGTTFMNDWTVFAVPGFLQFKAGAEFRWTKSIAKGRGGEVFIGDALIPRLQKFGSLIIIKIVAQDRQSMDPIMAFAIDQEISLMHYLVRNKNIATLLGWCHEPLSMIMKYYKLGSLEQYVASGQVYSKVVKVYFMLDVARGLRFMHSKRVAHCDVKPANALVDQNRHGRLFCALTDLGISQMFSEYAHLVEAFRVVNLRGVLIMYAAPEAVTRYRMSADATEQQAMAADVYSAGMIAFALVNTRAGWEY